MAQIEAKDIKKTYSSDGEEIRALQGVSFRIEKGEFVIIKGPSGSGKSTLMHILGLLDIPDKGKYVFEEEEVSSFGSRRLSELRNQKMGFVFQTFNLLPRTSALNNVAIPLFYGKKDKNWKMFERAREILDEVGLSKRAKHHPNQLSGGEQQRVAIARSLINSPEVILADEPTGNLDSKSAQSIMELLSDLNRSKKTTLIVVTHEDIIAKYGKRIIELKDGKVIGDHRR